MPISPIPRAINTLSLLPITIIYLLKIAPIAYPSTKIDYNSA